MRFSDWQEVSPTFSVGQKVKVAGKQARVIGFAFANDVRIQFGDGRETTIQSNQVTEDQA